MSRSYVLNLVPVKRRARFNRHTGRSYTPEQTVVEEQAVRDAYKGLWFPEDVPLAVRIDVYRALPKDRPRRIESEPDTITPDVDNIAKAVLDGLQDKTAQDGRVVQRGAYARRATASASPWRRRVSMTAGSGRRPHVSRKGEHHRPWTTSDVRYLRENAGHVPVAEIARHLKRSQQAIRSRACILGVSIRCYRRTLVWCDQCATWRTETDADGRCPICRLKDQLQAVEGRISDELQAAPQDVRELYARTESLRASAVKRVPMGEWQEGSEYDRMRVQEIYLRNVEEAERATLQRLVDAGKTRLKRIREKRGTNPRKNRQ